MAGMAASHRVKQVSPWATTPRPLPIEYVRFVGNESEQESDSPNQSGARPRSPPSPSNEVMRLHPLPAIYTSPLPSQKPIINGVVLTTPQERPGAGIVRGSGTVKHGSIQGETTTNRKQYHGKFLLIWHGFCAADTSFLPGFA